MDELPIDVIGLVLDRLDLQSIYRLVQILPPKYHELKHWITHRPYQITIGGGHPSSINPNECDQYLSLFSNVDVTLIEDNNSPFEILGQHHRHIRRCAIIVKAPYVQLTLEAAKKITSFQSEGFDAGGFIPFLAPLAPLKRVHISQSCLGPYKFPSDCVIDEMIIQNCVISHLGLPPHLQKLVIKESLFSSPIFSPKALSEVHLINCDDDAPESGAYYQQFIHDVVDGSQSTLEGFTFYDAHAESQYVMGHSATDCAHTIVEACRDVGPLLKKAPKLRRGYLSVVSCCLKHRQCCDQSEVGLGWSTDHQRRTTDLFMNQLQVVVPGGISLDTPYLKRVRINEVCASRIGLQQFEFPDTVTDLEMHSLQVTGPQFFAADALIRFPSHLTRLVLTNFKLESIPSGLPRTLEYLDISHNNLNDLPTFDDHYYLRTLVATHNDLTNINIFAPNLAYLLANGNPLRYVITPKTVVQVTLGQRAKLASLESLMSTQAGRSIWDKSSYKLPPRLAELVASRLNAWIVLDDNCTYTMKRALEEGFVTSAPKKRCA
ncbi:hypothetical protein DICA1_E03620 [Diutina catenulata]